MLAWFGLGGWGMEAFYCIHGLQASSFIISQRGMLWNLFALLSLRKCLHDRFLYSGSQYFVPKSDLSCARYDILYGSVLVGRYIS